MNQLSTNQQFENSKIKTFEPKIKNMTLEVTDVQERITNSRYI